MNFVCIMDVMDVYGCLWYFGIGIVYIDMWVGRLFMSHGCCWVMLDRQLVLRSLNMGRFDLPSGKVNR